MANKNSRNQSNKPKESTLFQVAAKRTWSGVRPPQWHGMQPRR